MLKKLQLFEFAFFAYEWAWTYLICLLITYISSSVNMSFTCFSIGGFSVFLNISIEDSNLLLYLWHTLWVAWYIYISILRLLTLVEIWFCVTYISFSEVLINSSRPSQISFPPKSLPTPLRCNEVSPLPSHHHIWFCSL